MSTRSFLDHLQALKTLVGKADIRMTILENIREICADVERDSPGSVTGEKRAASHELEIEIRALEHAFEDSGWEKHQYSEFIGKLLDNKIEKAHFGKIFRIYRQQLKRLSILDHTSEKIKQLNTPQGGTT